VHRQRRGLSHVGIEIYSRHVRSTLTLLKAWNLDRNQNRGGEGVRIDIRNRREKEKARILSSA